MVSLAIENAAWCLSIEDAGPWKMPKPVPNRVNFYENGALYNYNSEIDLLIIGVYAESIYV